MSTFNVQNAVVFGITADQLQWLFTDENGAFPGLGTISSITNSYATVLPFSTSNQPSGNANAIEALFPSINSGSNTYFTINQQKGTYSVYAVPNKAYFGVFSNTDAIQITQPQNATANLSNSTQTSSEVVAQSQLTFTFIPGTTQSLTLTYETGSTISNTVTNGISNTTTTGTTTTVTSGVSFTGEMPDASASVNQSVSQAWTQQQSQTISYTTSQQDTVDTNVSTSVTVDVNSATPNSNGTYTYTNTAGQTFTLVPNQQYIAAVDISTCAYNTPVPNSIQITGQTVTLPVTFEGEFYTDNEPIYGNYGHTASVNVETAIQLANSYGYQQYSNVSPTLFTYVASPVATATYSGLITSDTVTGTNAVVVILPVATTSDATVSPTTANSSKALSNAIASPATADGTITLNLATAAAKLSAQGGVFYDNTKTESSIHAGSALIIGGNHDLVAVGNLNYKLTKFSDSVVSVGNGNNIVEIAATENNNSFTIGNGNNKILLNGAGNSIHLGGGANEVSISGGIGKNYVIAGDGPTVLKINSASGFTQVSNWDNTQDYLNFGLNVKLSSVHVTFDSSHWAYDVYVGDNRVANILLTGGQTLADQSSTVRPEAYAAPIPYNLQSNAGFLNGLYVDAFNAAPDTAGITFWTQQLDAGMSRNAVIQSFFTSAQFNAQNPTNIQYVNSLYEDLLGRPADTAGLNYWTSMLDNGQSKTVIIGSILNSAEFNNLVGHG